MGIFGIWGWITGNSASKFRNSADGKRLRQNIERPEGTPISEWGPWRQWPDLRPNEISVNQGNQEFYWRYEWLPFWNSLTGEQKTDYLKTHNASQDWADRIKPGGMDDRMSALVDRAFEDDPERRERVKFVIGQ